MKICPSASSGWCGGVGFLEMIGTPDTVQQKVKVPESVAFYTVNRFTILSGQSVTTASTPRLATLSKCCGVFTP